MCMSSVLISIVHLSFPCLLDVKWTLSGASGDRILAVVVSCKFSAPHEFFIHREIEARREDDGGCEMAVYAACTCVDLSSNLSFNFCLCLCVLP